MVAICSSRNVQSVLEAALNMCTSEGREVTRGESAGRAGRGERAVRCCVCVCALAAPCLGASPSLHMRYAVQRPRAAQKWGEKKLTRVLKLPDDEGRKGGCCLRRTYIISPSVTEQHDAALAQLTTRSQT